MKYKIIFVTSCFLLALMPLGVKLGENPASTNVELMTNTGQYAYVARGCDNEVLHKQPLPLNELSAALDYKTNSPVRLGIKASYLSTKIEDDTYYGRDYKFVPITGWAVNPFLNLEADNIGIGGGAVWAENSMPSGGSVETRWFPSGYVRLGHLNTFYFDISLFHNIPLMSGNFINMGIGANSPEVEWWLGTGFGPYEHLGFTGKLYIPINERTSTHIFGRFGTTEAVADWSVGIGLRYRY